jgi:hypothetical protein
MRLLLPTALLTTAAIIAAPATADAKSIVRTVYADSSYVQRSPGFVVIRRLVEP